MGVDQLNLAEEVLYGLKYLNVLSYHKITRYPKDIYNMNYNNDIYDIEYCNLLNSIINPSKRVNSTNYCYYPILHGWINKCRGK